MKTIFQVLQEKEEQLRMLQAQIEKLRAAAEIVAQEQGATMPPPAPAAESHSRPTAHPPNGGAEPQPTRTVWP